MRERPFSEIYRTSPLFAALRDAGRLGGKCGICEYRQICGGCRARAYADSGNYLAEVHNPGGVIITGISTSISMAISGSRSWQVFRSAAESAVEISQFWQCLQ